MVGVDFPNSLELVLQKVSGDTSLCLSKAGTLKAPKGEHDDLAMAFINGLAGLPRENQRNHSRIGQQNLQRRWKSYEEERGEGVSVIIESMDILDELEM